MIFAIATADNENASGEYVPRRILNLIQAVSHSRTLFFYDFAVRTENINYTKL